MKWLSFTGSFWRSYKEIYQSARDEFLYFLPSSLFFTFLMFGFAPWRDFYIKVINSLFSKEFILYLLMLSISSTVLKRLITQKFLNKPWLCSIRDKHTKSMGAYIGAFVSIGLIPMLAFIAIFRDESALLVFIGLLLLFAFFLPFSISLIDDCIKTAKDAILGTILLSVGVFLYGIGYFEEPVQNDSLEFCIFMIKAILVFLPLLLVCMLFMKGKNSK